ncbi:MAG: sugar phosphate nucleotidyltransferase [Pseudomonadota bacterium]|nr:sugar phosphate nucleotidyltransferase [Pseudomonadota bacterium]
MNHRFNTWAVVLAGGEGSRLHRLTRNRQGVVVPKQFCSLRGGASLIHEALQRAAAVAPLPRVCAVVAEQHRQWWTPILSYLPEKNVIVQPQNRGTAFGILLPLLQIAARDPDATVVLLPADHYLRDEQIMATSLRRAAELAESDRESIYLLGVEPDEPDTELGYILPAARSPNQAAAVLRFIEKPSEIRARVLLDQGALWNVFIMAASASALLGLFEGKHAAAMAAIRGCDVTTIETVYQRLSSVDFSRDILQGKESLLKVLAVPHCGWTDLGTPKGIALALEHLQAKAGRAASDADFPVHVNLADQVASLHLHRMGVPRSSSISQI